MPQRIKEVFALEKSGEKGKCRYNRLCSFNYSDEELAQSENVMICKDASYIKDDEKIARIIEDPTTVNFQAGLAYTPGAFGDASKWGLSVQRESLTTRDEIESFGRKKAAEKDRIYRGFVSSEVGTLRRERSQQNNRRLVAVYSSPLENLTAHADVYASLPKPTPEEKEATKALFWRAFNLDAIVEQYLADQNAAKNN